MVTDLESGNANAAPETEAPATKSKRSLLGKPAWARKCDVKSCTQKLSLFSMYH